MQILWDFIGKLAQVLLINIWQRIGIESIVNEEIGTYILNGPKRHPDFGRVFRSILERIGAHPGLVGWYPSDPMPSRPFPRTVGRYPNRPDPPGLSRDDGARADSEN